MTFRFDFVRLNIYNFLYMLFNTHTHTYTHVCTHTHIELCDTHYQEHGMFLFY